MEATALTLNWPFGLNAASASREDSPLGTSVSPSPAPAPQYALVGPIAPGWSVVRPLLLTFSRDEDDYCYFADDEFFMYGDGPNRGQALQDYISSLIHYYELVAEGAVSNMYDKALLCQLREFIRPIA
jgi:hypothetical protein